MIRLDALPVFHIRQGGLLKLNQEEIEDVSLILEKHGISKECIDFQQGIVVFPKGYVGYLHLRERSIIIDPKHEGLQLKHVFRIYYFLYSTDSSDLDDEMYDLDSGDINDIIALYLKELSELVKKGLPVEYKVCNKELRYLRGNMNVINTVKNYRLRKSDVFDCTYDDLAHDIPLNRVLFAAYKKSKLASNDFERQNLDRYFSDVSNNLTSIPTITLNTNTSYCKKAVTLALAILQNLNISDFGNGMYGQSLLIDFDKLFEDFIKAILTKYSGDYNFTYWENSKEYGIVRDGSQESIKTYLPDMLYNVKEMVSGISAYCILDMKNKTSHSFVNADVYQMLFYANQLNAKKVILCYPSVGHKNNAILKFNNETFVVRKIHAAYINLLGNTAAEFKQNINLFINNVESIL